MNTKVILLSKIGFPALLVLLPGVLVAQSYSIDWYKVSGGGGNSTGGGYSLTRTVGQPDAGGQMTGGNFSLSGGFWALYAVQTPGAPLLTIQWNNDLRTTNWSNFAGTVTDDGMTKSATISPPSGTLFFRLKK